MRSKHFEHGHVAERLIKISSGKDEIVLIAVCRVDLTQDGQGTVG